uniref:Novel immune-type receptor 1 isoform 1 n=1 Tax=Oryzias latipes TaxID=8090 RepID=B3TZ92_ORYLA|nr:novel immune-type receptor 1 [Oryzias latipes]ACB86909.1 novel immune-type receptor 1 isoform 1 [Oryzias latipes]
MGTPAQFVVILKCLLSGNTAQRPLGSSSSAHQESVFLSAHIGETETLQCFYDGVYLRYILWYKHILGRNPKIIAYFTKYNPEKQISHEYQNNPRFTLKTSEQSSNLTISDLQPSDSATYFCITHHYTYLFSQTAFTVGVKGSGLTIQTSVDQSSSENIHAGDSVTLNCTVHTGSCDEEHRVYWFKDSEDSHPGLIYTHGGRNDQCERKNNTQTHSCFYKLSIKNLTESHAGIYYCAVVSCGHILFGNGTKLDLTDSAVPVNSVILNTLVGLLTVMSVLVVFLLFLLWKIHKSNNCTSTEERSPAAPLRSSEAENKDAESLHYAAVNVKKSNRSRRQNDNSNNDCLYASVRQQN